MSELRECPFCGGDVRYEEMMDGAYSFACPDCGLNARFPECFTDRDGSTRIWNARAERTCHYFPDSVQVAFDENDEEIETGETCSDGCDYTCDACGFTMLGGEEGWFDETPGEYGIDEECVRGGGRCRYQPCTVAQGVRCCAACGGCYSPCEKVKEVGL